MLQVQATALTLAEFLEMPETKPATEYIEGQIIPKPMPQGKHSAIQAELTAAINTVVKQQKIASAFPELRCTFDGRSTVPDLAVFTWGRIPIDENGEIANVFPLAPDWTIEILSPEQSHTKVTKNILHCLKSGTQMGWLIDPAEKTVLIYRPKQEVELLDEPNTLLPVPSFIAELNLTIAELFAWLSI